LLQDYAKYKVLTFFKQLHFRMNFAQSKSNCITMPEFHFTIDPRRRKDLLDMDRLSRDNLVQSGKFVDWYRFDQPFLATLDGTTGKGLIFRPEPEEPEIMDEEESSGI